MNHSCEGGTIVHPNWLLLRLLHRECKWTLVYPFKPMLTEGEVYQIVSFGEDENTGFCRTTRHEFRLNFQLTTTVKKVERVPIPLYGVKLVSFEDILRNDFESPFSVDTMGLLIAIGTEKEYDKDGKKTRMIAIQLEVNNVKLEVALFGQFVEQAQNFIANHDGSAESFCY